MWQRIGLRLNKNKMKFKIDKIIDEYNSDKNYVIIKFISYYGKFPFKKGQNVDISKVK
jgi:hypothetical protein